MSHPYHPTVRLALAETSSHGGLLHYTVQLADGLAGRGHEVDLLVPRGNELQGRSGPARRQDVLTPHVRSQGAPPRNPVAYQARRVAIAVRLTRSWVRIILAGLRGRHDVLITGADIANPVGGLAMLALLALPRRAAVVYICHNVRPFNRWKGESMFLEGASVLLQRVYRKVDLIVVHGDRSREEFEQLWQAKRVAIVPHGDERLFGDPPPPADEERILFFGDWRKVKGLPQLMDAFDLLAARRPSVRLTIAGTPAPADFDPAEVHTWAAGHGDRVRIVDDYIPIEDVPAVFGTARVVVTPYVVGYQSGVLHLAQTMGRAVVTTDVGDLGEAVGDGVGGYVVPAGDVAALADRLEQVVADRDLAVRLGEAGHARLGDRATWEVAAERMEQAVLAAVPRLAQEDRKR